VSKLGPEHAFLVLGALTALLLLLLTPPFQVPDEAAHFFRAYSLSEGRLSGVRLGGKPGVVVPESVVATKEAWEQKIPFHPEARLDLDRALPTFGMPLDPERWRFKPVSNAIVTIAYPPVPYLPQAVGIALGRMFEAPPIFLFYLGRLANAVAALLLCGMAIRLVPFGKWPLLLLMLTPVSCFLRSSVSADAVTLGLVFANFSAGLGIATAQAPPAPKLARFYVATAILLVLCKYAYFWVPLVILLGLRRVPARNLLGPLALAGFAGLLLLGAWYAWVRDIANPIAPGSDPRRQLLVIVADPFGHVALLAEHFTRWWIAYYRGLVGTLGWVDTPLPGWFVHLYWLVVGGLTLTHESPHFDRFQRLALIGVAILGYLTVVNTLFVTMPMAAQEMRGMQARYLIPAAPFLVFAVLGARPVRAYAAYAPALCCALVVVSLLVTATTLAMRYYVMP
jgi:hypothetical protein